MQIYRTTGPYQAVTKHLTRLHGLNDDRDTSTKLHEKHLIPAKDHVWGFAIRGEIKTCRLDSDRPLGRPCPSEGKELCVVFMAYSKRGARRTRFESVRVRFYERTEQNSDADPAEESGAA